MSLVKIKHANCNEIIPKVEGVFCNGELAINSIAIYHIMWLICANQNNSSLSGFGASLGIPADGVH